MVCLLAVLPPQHERSESTSVSLMCYQKIIRIPVRINAEENILCG